MISKLEPPKKPEKKIKIDKVIFSKNIFKDSKPIVLGSIDLPYGSSFKDLKISARLDYNPFYEEKHSILIEVYDTELVDNSNYVNQLALYQGDLERYNQQLAKIEKLKKFCELLGQEYTDELGCTANALDILFEKWTPEK